jgi:hypothetical protein
MLTEHMSDRIHVLFMIKKEVFEWTGKWKNSDSEFIFQIHKLVKYQHPTVANKMEEKRLGKTLSQEERKQLEKKVMEAFRNQTKPLSEEFQRILADDVVTAFQNRLTTLLRIQSKHTD